MALPALSHIDDDAGAASVAEWLRARCGLHFENGKLNMLRQRLHRVMETQGVANFATLADILHSNANLELAEAVVGAATTHHTYFLREEATLTFFRDTILPAHGEKEIRVWSAAASTGDEAYSCAILAVEALGREAARRKVSFLGTDISAAVIAQAERAEYTHSHLESVDEALLQRHFVAQGRDRWRVASNIRGMCLFRRLNLKVSPFPFQQRFHAVFCRNVLYYFDIPTQLDLIERIYDVTEPGGYLLVSATDNLRGLGGRWSSVQSGVYRRLA